jgi:NADH oxidase (H2O2-forming)
MRRVQVAQRIVVIGGGAAGIGAAGAAKATDPSADVRVYTELEDVGDLLAHGKRRR